MASADFCMGFPAPLDVGSTEVPLGTLADLPGYDAPTFTLMPVGYTSRRSVQVSGFADICLLTPPCRLISASCSSGQRFAFSFLQISSRPEHPCRSANSSPCRASRGLPPPSECALPGAQQKKPASAGFLFGTRRTRPAIAKFGNQPGHFAVPAGLPFSPMCANCAPARGQGRPTQTQAAGIGVDCQATICQPFAPLCHTSMNRLLITRGTPLDKRSRRTSPVTIAVSP